MAFFSGRFDPIEVDAEVKELYRNRDNDEQYKGKRGQLVDPSQVYAFNVDGWKIAGIRFNFNPTDPIYLSMTDDERIENGLPSRFKLFSFSSYGIFSVVLLGAWATVLYSRVYYPGGIILRNQRKEGIAGYLYKRLPICLLFAYAIYITHGYRQNYNIDYYSEDEEIIDRQFASVRNAH